MEENDKIREKVVRLEERLRASDKALEIARESMTERLKGMNEFRNQLKDQAATFISRTEFESKIETLKSGRRDNIAIAIAIVAVLIALLKDFILH